MSPHLKAHGLIFGKMQQKVGTLFLSALLDPWTSPGGLPDKPKHGFLTPKIMSDHHCRL